MAFPILPVLAGVSLLGGLLGQRKTQAKSIPSLTPEQQEISGLIKSGLVQGFGRDYSGLRGASEAALGRALAVDPVFAQRYGTMGLRAVQTAAGAVPTAQKLWREPYELGLQYLSIPQMATYLEQPGANPLMQMLGMILPQMLGGGTSFSPYSPYSTYYAGPGLGTPAYY